MTTSTTTPAPRTADRVARRREFLALLRLEWRLVLRDKITVPLSLGIPVALLIAFGVPSGTRAPSADLDGARPIDTLLPSLAVTVAVVLLAFTQLPNYIGMYRERGVLRRLSATPARPLSLLLAHLVINLGLAIGATALILAIGMPAFGMRFPGHVLGFVASMLLGLAALFAIGLLIAARAPSGQTATGWGFLAFFPSMFFAGAYLPKEQMPEWLGRLGEFTPLGGFRQTVQDSWQGVAPDVAVLGFLGVFAVAVTWLAARTFRWQ